jgi:hypothetical protein
MVGTNVAKGLPAKTAASFRDKREPDLLEKLDLDRLLPGRRTEPRPSASPS